MTQDAITVPLSATRELLLRLAGPRAFVHGESYLAEGRVRSLHEDGTVIAGVVEGSEPYRVEVRRGEGGGSQLLAACTCPHGADGRFCKHAVAVALAGMAEREGEPAADDDLRDWLERQRHAVLVDLLAEAADGDPELAARLAALRDLGAERRRGVRRW